MNNTRLADRSASGNIATPPSYEARARPKPQLSCTLCRSKKLKCDRGQPCKNCAKKPAGSCIYVAQPRSRKTVTGSFGGSASAKSQSGTVNDRIRRLERLVTSLAGTPGQSRDQAGDGRGPEGKSIDAAPREDHGVANPSPHFTAGTPDARFVDPTHWEAVLEDIDSIKQELNTSRSSESWDDTEASPDDSQGPELLFGDSKILTIEELICSIPSKTLVDELMRIFTQENDIPHNMIHIPKFLSELAEFWNDPSAASLPWLSVLYSIMSMTLQLAIRTGVKVEGVLLPEPLSRTYRTKAAQCLRASDYGRPTAYTLEALILYMICEHFWAVDGFFRGSMLFAVILRLALRAGYHRDPSHYRQISVFDAEMRRRTWAFLLESDALLAHKCALPRQIDERQADTKPPLNVLDEDLYPAMKEPPKPRPNTEATSIGFSNYKISLLEVGINIVERFVTPGLSFDEVITLDQALNARVENRPAWLDIPIDDATLSPIALNRLIELDIIANTLRIILHRKFLVPARTNPRYARSRKACLKAATRILQHQQRLYDVFFNHYGTVAANWRSLSLMSHDLLMAAMVICMDMDQELQSPPQSRTKEEEEGLDERFELLKACHRIYSCFVSYTSSARKAAEVLRIMLDRLRDCREEHVQSVETSQAPAQAQSPNHFFPAQLISSSNLGNQPYGAGLASPTAAPGSYTQPIFPATDAVTNELAGIGAITAGYGAVPQGAGAVDEFALANFLEKWDWTQWDSELPSSTMGFE